MEKFEAGDMGNENFSTGSSQKEALLFGIEG
jgi:hypothetical protein